MVLASGKSIYSRGNQREWILSLGGVLPQALPEKPPQKQQMGNEYWPGDDGSHSIKISNREVVGAGGSWWASDKYQAG